LELPAELTGLLDLHCPNNRGRALHLAFDRQTPGADGGHNVTLTLHHDVAAGEELAHRVVTVDLEVLEDEPFVAVRAEDGHGSNRHVEDARAVGASDASYDRPWLRQARGHRQAPPAGDERRIVDSIRRGLPFARTSARA